MKIRHLLLLTPLLALLGCTIETDSSGDLGGYWHLESVDTIATGGHADLRSRRVFWAVQGELLRATDKDNGGDYLLRYVHQNDTLTLSEPRTNNRTAGDPEVSDATLLYPFGIRHLTERFTIESLHSSSMVIASEDLRLGFKKF